MPVPRITQVSVLSISRAAPNFAGVSRATAKCSRRSAFPRSWMRERCPRDTCEDSISLPPTGYVDLHCSMPFTARHVTGKHPSLHNAGLQSTILGLRHCFGRLRESTFEQRESLNRILGRNRANDGVEAADVCSSSLRLAAPPPHAPAEVRTAPSPAPCTRTPHGATASADHDANAWAPPPASIPTASAVPAAAPSTPVPTTIAPSAPVPAAASTPLHLRDNGFLD